MSSSSSRLSLHCSYTTKDDGSLPSSFTITKQSVNFRDLRQNEDFRFDFDGIFNGSKGLDDGYKSILAPLADKTSKGGSSLCVMCGSPFLDTGFFIPGSSNNTNNTSTAYLKRVASQLLDSRPDGGCVTFSWFNLECNGNESIVDVLRAASNPKGSNADSSLILREIGKSRGMTVPGLTQVELGSASDVEAVVKHVKQVLADQFPSPNFHSVIQFTFADSHEALHKATGSYSKSITLEDQPGIGRLTFICLSSLSPMYPLKFNEESLQEVHPWVELLAEALESGRTDSGDVAETVSTDPFHKSRLLLLLRDAMLGKQPASVLLNLDLREEETSSDAFTWLQLVSQLDSLEGSNTTTSGVPPVAQPVPGSAQKEKSKTTTSRSSIGNDDNNNDNNSSTVRSKGKGSNKKKSKKGKSNSNSGNVIDDMASSRSSNTTTSSLSQSHSITSSGIFTSGNYVDLLPRPSSSPAYPPVPPLGGSDFVGASGDKLYSDDINDEEVGDVEEKDAHALESHSSGVNVSASSKKGVSFVEGMVGVGVDMTSAATTMTAFDKNSDDATGSASTTATPSIDTNTNDEYGVNGLSVHGLGFLSRTRREEMIESRTGIPSPSREKDRETIHALMDSLQETRKDYEKVKADLSAERSRFAECRDAYDGLVGRLKDEAPMLKERDRLRFKECLQELKDYEVYKEVMETAMLKLQEEIRDIRSDNEYLKSKEGNAQKKLMRNRSLVSKYNADTSNILKRNKELEAAVAELNSRLKKAEAGKDAAVKSLSNTKITLGKQVNQLKKIEEDDSRLEVKYKRQIHGLETACKVLQEDKDKAVDDLKKMKQASGKSLAMIMELQEENDRLRGAVATLADKSGLLKSPDKTKNTGGGASSTTASSEGATTSATEE